MLPRMNIQQRRQANKLIKHLCANYQDGNCLLLDDGEPCVCVQSIAFTIMAIAGSLIKRLPVFLCPETNRKLLFSSVSYTIYKRDDRQIAAVVV